MWSCDANAEEGVLWKGSSIYRLIHNAWQVTGNKTVPEAVTVADNEPR